MTPLSAARTRLEGYLVPKHSRAGFLARQLAQRPAPNDAVLAGVLRNERRAATRMDGSIGGSLLDTAWAAWEIMDLGADVLDGGLSRLVGWVVSTLEGAAVATATGALALPNGAVLSSVEEALFAARCIGLRVALRARQGERPGIVQQVADLATQDQPTLTLTVSALGAVALAPPPHHAQVDHWVQRVAEAQGADGGWTGSDRFHVLEGLMLAGTKAARTVITRAVPVILGFEPEDDAPVTQERAWIAYRALHVAADA